MKEWDGKGQGHREKRRDGGAMAMYLLHGWQKAMVQMAKQKKSGIYSVVMVGESGGGR